MFMMFALTNIEEILMIAYILVDAAIFSENSQQKLPAPSARGYGAILQRQETSYLMMIETA